MQPLYSRSGISRYCGKRQAFASLLQPRQIHTLLGLCARWAAWCSISLNCLCSSRIYACCVSTSSPRDWRGVVVAARGLEVHGDTVEVRCLYVGRWCRSRARSTRAFPMGNNARTGSGADRRANAICRRRLPIRDGGGPP